jgi:hypothetical protein
MTDTQGQQPSAFNQRADNAALTIKDQLGRELSAKTGQEVVLPPSPVPVNADGSPVGQLPPEGSYARQQIEAQQQQALLQQQQMQAQLAYDPSAAPTQRPAQQEQSQPQEQISQRAQERISSLVSQLRQKDQEYQQLQQAQTQQATTVEELRAQLAAQQNQLESVLEQHLDNLDPEARAQIMNDARIRQAIAQSERRVMNAVGPQLEALQARNIQLEKAGLSRRYAGYDPTVHDELIDSFRQRNPNCSVEQAFRACATPEELSVGSGSRPANAPPPAMPPSSGSNTPRYLEQQQAAQPSPIEQIRIDAARAAELARSTDPEDQKAAARLWDKNLADRVFGTQDT